VQASDAASNLADEALNAETMTARVLVDNTRPTVTLSTDGAVIKGTATDAASRVVALQVSIDGGDWRSINAKDGFLDSRKESFEVKLPKLSRGSRIVRVRAFDQEMNIGIASAMID
jgi:hypothetical protein